MGLQSYLACDSLGLKPKVAKSISQRPECHTREKRVSRSFDFPGFGIALAIASLPWNDAQIIQRISRLATLELDPGSWRHFVLDSFGQSYYFR
jgi:hypothetical protein